MRCRTTISNSTSQCTPEKLADIISDSVAVSNTGDVAETPTKREKTLTKLKNNADNICEGALGSNSPRKSNELSS